MREGWEIKRLGEVMQLEYGKPLDNTKRNSKGRYPIYGANGIKGRTNEFFYNKKTIIVGRKGSAGEINLTEEKFWPLDVTYFLTFDERKYDLMFLFHLLSFLNLTKLAKGVKPGINRNEVYSIYAQFPPFSEQQRIVSILDEAFIAIAKAKANAEQNLKNAKELFESYLQGVFENKGVGWEEKKLSQIAKVIGGYSFKSGDFIEQGRYQVIRMGNVRPGIIRENENPVFIDKLDGAVLKRALLLCNDVIITQTGTKKKRDYGFTVIINKDNYLLNQRISAIRFSENYLPKFFLYYSWTNLFKDQYFANETGTVGQGNVGIGAITGAMIPFPPLKEQQAIVKKLDALSAETKKLEAIYQKRIEDLEELKKAVLGKAFRGELVKRESVQELAVN